MLMLDLCILSETPGGYFENATQNFFNEYPEISWKRYLLLIAY